MVVPQDVVRVRVHPSVTVISEKAFYQRRKLKEVELCEGLLEIGSYAFSGCWERGLKRISIPSSVRVIGSYAFNHCTKLEEVILCEGLLEIGSHAFYYCEALKSIRIPSTVTMIHDHAFFFCEGLVDVELCKGLQEIGSHAFLACPLKQITIPSTVKIIHQRAFKECTKLEQVELSEGLVEIGFCAFYNSLWLNSIRIPSTVKTIGSWAFCHTSLETLSLPDNIESIGDHAFWNGEFTTIRIPSLVTTISESMCHSRSLFSMELSESIKRLDNEAFISNPVLRNLALPSDAEIGVDAFKDCIDLKELGTERNIISALKHRFDNLPIHKMLYYQSYCREKDTRSKLHDPSIKHQDTLGMTPPHILACSTVQNIEVYKVLIEKHPESLITEDKWGAVPLLYAVWSHANSETVQLLVQSYKSIFPNYEFNWTTMMETLGIFSAAGKEIKRLHNIQRESFPDQSIDLDTLLENAITRSNPDHSNYITQRSLQVFTTRIISTRALAIRYRPIRIQIMESIRTEVTPDTIQGRRDYVNNVYKNLEIIEDKYDRMIEAFTMFELLLWKNKMDDCCRHQRKTRQTKKTRMDDSSMRKKCRIRCGAETNIVIEHVLPYLDYFST